VIVLYLLFFIGCLGGAIWMPIVGWIIGQIFVKKEKALQNVKPVLGGIIGAIIGFVIWLVYVLPNLSNWLPMQ
jgi:hypothetical protein